VTLKTDQAPLWAVWQKGLDRLTVGDMASAADAFYEATRLQLDGLWQASPADPLSEAVAAIATVAAEVLTAHGDSAGATDLLEFAWERGRRDATLVTLLCSLLAERRELALARNIREAAALTGVARDADILAPRRNRKVVRAGRAHVVEQGRNAHG